MKKDLFYSKFSDFSFFQHFIDKLLFEDQLLSQSKNIKIEENEIIAEMQKRQRELEADNASLRAEVTDLMKQMREEINKVTLGAPFGGASHRRK